MCAVNAHHVVAIWCFIQTTSSQRRIVNGKDVTQDMPFIVYFLEAGPYPVNYNYWTCGGSIVSPQYIITSAACFYDTTHVYAIAGYKTFVEASHINTDPCTRERKKKVVIVYFPKKYDYNFTELVKWAMVDIAVVKVESPYNFNDKTFRQVCSYTPAPIRVNYEQKYQSDGVEVIALGWGYADTYLENFHESYNADKLQYTSTSIYNKAECKKFFSSGDEKFDKKNFYIIDKYMICTLHPGNLDDDGNLVKESQPNMNGCINNCTDGDTCEEDHQLAHQKKLRTAEIIEENNEKPNIIVISEIVESDEIAEPEKPNQNMENNDQGIGHKTLEHNGESDINTYEFRRQRNGSNLRSKESKRNFTRRNGICRNDHGSPLVTWIGNHLVLLGVASVFNIDEDKSICIGPSLYTSTKCLGKFLDCVLHESLSNGKDDQERQNCHPVEKSEQVLEKRISWISHPDGPAQNEIIETRPQVSIHQYHSDNDRK